MELKRLRDFLASCEKMQQDHDSSVGRNYNQDSFGHWVRKASRYLTYIFFRLGVRGEHLLFAHGVMDWLAIGAFATHHVWTALALMAAAHVLDNCDGDLARARGEASPEWQEVDHLFHTITNNLFWVMVALCYGQGQYLVPAIIILPARNIMGYFRWRAGKREFGERGKLWSILTYPTNINVQHIGFALAVLSATTPYFIGFFAVYYLIASVGRSVLFVVEIARRVSGRILEVIE